MKPKSESRQQQELMGWLNFTYPKLASHTFHVPNGEWRGTRVGAKLKLMGVKPGVPDLMCVMPVGKYTGLALELKTDTGKPSEKQLEWIDRLQAAGWCTVIANGIDQAQVAFTEYAEGIL